MADFSKYENKQWFIELKKNRSDFYNVKNIIESAKEKYERNNRVYEWITGSGLAIIFSLGIGDILGLTAK